LVNFVMKREIVAYKEHFRRFYRSQDVKVRRKINYILDLIRFEDQIPAKFFKQIGGYEGIYEIRIITSFRSIRVLCMLDIGGRLILLNGFVKKGQKTPVKELRIAYKLTKQFKSEKQGTT